MIRTLHHMADPALTLGSVRRVLAQNSQFLLEFANKRNLKSIGRWLLGRQKWNPFSPEQVEFVQLNYNFHPKTVLKTLEACGFKNESSLGVSHFRTDWFKKHIKHERLVKWDASLQNVAPFKNYTPSIFTLNQAVGGEQAEGVNFFACPICGEGLLVPKRRKAARCGHDWEYKDGIYEFRINPEINLPK